MTTDGADWLIHVNPMSGPSYKVALVLALCGVTPCLHFVDLRAGEQRAPEFLAKNPFGQVPVLEHRGRSLAQSASILEYVAAVTGRLGATDEADRAEIRAWMYWDFDRLASSLYRARTARLGIRPLDPAVVAHYEQFGAQALDTLEAHLTGRDWLVGGAVTIADVDVYGTVGYAADAGFDLSARPAISAWIARIEALPGWAPPAKLLAPV